MEGGREQGEMQCVFPLVQPQWELAVHTTHV